MEVHPEQLEPEIKHYYSDLKKYYKSVRLCKVCKFIYGSDYEEGDNGLCPGCETKIHKEAAGKKGAAKTHEKKKKEEEK